MSLAPIFRMTEFGDETKYITYCIPISGQLRNYQSYLVSTQLPPRLSNISNIIIILHHQG